MKTILTTFFLACSLSLFSQTFEDNLSGETQGEFPSKWNLVQGSAEVSSLDGPTISLSNNAIISPKINGTTYLSQNFTVDFDVFFDSESKLPLHQYYEIRFWSGHSYLTLDNGQGFMNPLNIYCDGARMTGKVNTKKVDYKGNLEAMKKPLDVWKHVTVQYNNGAMTVMVDNFQAIKLPVLPFRPKMISIGAFSGNYADFDRAIKNITITGIDLNTDSSDTNNTGNEENLNNQTLGLNYQLPVNDGLPNQILQTDGNGQLFWIDIPTITSNDSIATSNVNTPTGLEAIDEGNGIGWRLIGSDPNKYGNIGENAIDLSYNNQYVYSYGATGTNSFASGVSTTASGKGSIAMGGYCRAKGDYSISIGNGNTASGEYSTALGFDTRANGKYSIAFGHSTKSNGDSSSAFGYQTQSNSAFGFVIGIRNIGLPNALFEIGNGPSNTASNALTVLNNSNIGIGTHAPQAKLHITDGEDVALNKGGYLVLGDRQNRNLAFDANEIMARNNVQPATLYLQQEGGDVFVGGSVVHSSDARLKESVTELPYGLTEILKLQPVAYYWKSDSSHVKKSLGLIAQDVQPILSEIVTIKDNEDKTLGINYTELIPVLIKAIHEQQDIIANLENEKHIQEKRIQELSADNKEILLRIEKLETLLNN